MKSVSQAEDRDAEAARRSRLLRLLGEAGAFARIEEADALVFAPRRGVTVRIGMGTASDLAALESAGAVRRVAGRRQPSFVLDAAGASRARREAAAPSERFLVQHGARVVEDRGPDAGPVAVNLRESPLLWLHRRGGAGASLIGDAEFAAGERLRCDMTLARTLPSMSTDWARPSRSGVAMALTPSETRVAAGQRVRAALRTVGPELSGILVDVCGFLKGLDAIERERGWPARSAKLVLRLALSGLARHYGIGDAAVGVAGPRRVRRWAAAGADSVFSAPGPEPSAPPS